jgi:predicted metal-dependent hydrolase
MRRVQSAVSGRFDAIRGQEILDAVQGLIGSEEHYSQEHADC